MTPEKIAELRAEVAKLRGEAAMLRVALVVSQAAADQLLETVEARDRDIKLLQFELRQSDRMQLSVARGELNRDYQRAAPRVKLEWADAGRPGCWSSGSRGLLRFVASGDSARVYFGPNEIEEYITEFIQNADEAKAACEAWAQELVEELTR